MVKDVKILNGFLAGAGVAIAQPFLSQALTKLGVNIQDEFILLGGGILLPVLFRQARTGIFRDVAQAMVVIGANRLTQTAVSGGIANLFGTAPTTTGAVQPSGGVV